MQFTGQKAEQPASTACLLARKCNRLARKMAANMRNAICVRTQTSKVPTQDILLVSSLFCADTLLVHISGFVHRTRTKITPFDSAFQALYIAPTFVYLQCNANNL